MVQYRVMETYKDKNDLELRFAGKTYDITNKRADEINDALGREFVRREDSFNNNEGVPEQTEEASEDDVEETTDEEPEE